MAKILLVEDDKNLREIYGVRLLAEGYDIVSAGDGEEALAMAIKERPALILSDVMMPKISGFDMLDILRSTTETKDIKVIMMTALSSEDQRQRGEQLGADRYLVKSQVGIEDVVRTVHEVLADVPGMEHLTRAQAMEASAPHLPPTAGTSGQAVARPSVDQLSPQPQAPTVPTPHAAATPQATPTAQPQPVPAAPPTPVAPPAAAPSAPAANPMLGPQLPTPSSGLPQPTAPFSSSAPRPSNLGGRVIQPLSSPDDASSIDMAAQMAQALSDTSQPAALSQPAVQHIPVQAQAPATQPAASTPQQPTPAAQPALTTAPHAAPGQLTAAPIPASSSAMPIPQPAPAAPSIAVAPPAAPSIPPTQPPVTPAA